MTITVSASPIWPERKLVFEVTRAQDEVQIANWLHNGDKLAAHHPPQPTSDPRVTYLFHRFQDGDYSHLFFLDGKCEASITAEVPDKSKLSKLRSIFGQERQFVEFHSVSRLLRGRGYVSFIYERALDQGIVIMSKKHTSDAAKFWENLAKRRGVSLVYVRIDAPWGDELALTSYHKVMVP